MKSEAEIHRAHDILIAIVLGEVTDVFENKTEKLHMISALDALCWVLDHAHNQQFSDNLAKLEAQLSAKGFKLCSLEERPIGPLNPGSL